MLSLLIDELYIFDVIDRKAKKVEFSSGINVVTSNKIDGTDRGKSMILKAIYHTLGADAFFNAQWEIEKKEFIIKITIADDSYYIYRKQNFFKIFNDSYNLLFSTTNRTELATKLETIFNFSVYLPARGTDKLEITPPAYSYLLNFLDQDHINGPEFDSFTSLGQYSNYKEFAVLAHCGVFNKDYYELANSVKNESESIEKIKKEQLFITNMLSRIDIYIGDLKTPFSIETLDIELNKHKNEYETIINQLNKIKCSLINLRNNKYEIEKEIEEIDLFSKNKSKEIENLHCTCPVCNQEINSIEEKLKENYKIEEYLVLKNEYSVSLHEIDRKISLEQIKYQGFLDKLKFYEDKVSSGDSKISNVLNHLAYGETRDRLLKDFQINEEKIEKLNISYKENSKKLRSYNDLKTKAHNLYSTYMFESKHSFNLAEISDDKIKKIGQNFEWRGSNRPITTLAGVGQRFGASS